MPTPECSTTFKSKQCLTCQTVLFPKHWCLAHGEKIEQFERRIQTQLFDIKDDLLYACITYGEGLQESPVRGFTHDKGLGYALLAFFTQRALGLYRLPYCGDRVYAAHLGKETQAVYRETLQSLSEQRVESICQELSALYHHTQTQLKAKEVKNVVLRRCVKDQEGVFGRDEGYAELLFKLSSACTLAGRKNLKFEMDILNSYGDDHAYGHFPVAIITNIPAEDILYCSNLVRSRQLGLGGSPGMAVEDGEWVVINRSPTGIVDLPVTSIHLNSHGWEDTLPLKFSNPEKALAFIARFEPVALQPDGACKLRSYYDGGFLKMKWLMRLRTAFFVLSKGRLPHF